MSAINKKEIIGIICPSPKGKNVAFTLAKELNAVLYIKVTQEEVENMSIENSLDTHIFTTDFKLSRVTEEAVEGCERIIFVSSTGIAVRAMAPFIQKKDKDPGVVVVDLWAKYAISLLSGHLGGGNDLTLKVAEILDCEPIITTATDGLGIVAPDIIAKNNNLIIDNLKTAKHIAALLVNGLSVGLKDDCNMVKATKGYVKLNELKNDSIWITDRLNFENNCTDDVQGISCSYDKERILKLIRKDIILGIGCRRDTPYEKIDSFVRSSLKQHNFDIRSVSKIVSVDVKKNEQGIIKFAESLDVPFETFAREEIRTVQNKYEKSEFVLKTLGITGVCEPSVDLGGGHVIISKIKHEGMTLAIGRKREFENKTEE